MLGSKNPLVRLGKSVKSSQGQRVGQHRTGTPTLLALAVAAALAGGVPASADAAGLGRLTVQSALGQPLRAEVEVTALGREEAGSLSARLAPVEAFRQAGLEFNPALSNLRFAVDRRANGAAVVRITSSQPINEPFVDLLVEFQGLGTSVGEILSAALAGQKTADEALAEAQALVADEMKASGYIQ